MKINDVHVGVQGNTKRMRVARGPGSGKGKTAGRGGKGQTARAGYKALSIFQGGATPLVRRIPKRGFTNSFALDVHGVNVSELEAAFEAGEEVTPETLVAKNVVRARFDLIKILGDGQITKKLKVSAHRFSQSARQKIEAAGGEAIELPGRVPVAEKQKQKKAASAAKK